MARAWLFKATATVLLGLSLAEVCDSRSRGLGRLEEPGGVVTQCLPIGNWADDSQIMSAAYLLPPDLIYADLRFTDVLYEANDDVLNVEPALIIGREHMPGFTLELKLQPDGTYRTPAPAHNTYEIHRLPVDYSLAQGKFAAVGLLVSVRADGRRNPPTPLIRHAGIEYEDRSGKYTVPVQNRQWVSRAPMDAPDFCAGSR